MASNWMSSIAAILANSVSNGRIRLMKPSCASHSSLGQANELFLQSSQYLLVHWPVEHSTVNVAKFWGWRRFCLPMVVSRAAQPSHRHTNCERQTGHGAWSVLAIRLKQGRQRLVLTAIQERQFSWLLPGFMGPVGIPFSFTRELVAKLS